LRHQADAVTGQALAGIALGDAIDLAVNRRAGGAEGQDAGLVQQLFEVEVGAFADQFEVETERLVDGFAPVKLSTCRSAEAPSRVRVMWVALASSMP
jgi:hypothetical protein